MEMRFLRRDCRSGDPGEPVAFERRPIFPSPGPEEVMRVCPQWSPTGKPVVPSKRPDVAVTKTGEVSEELQECCENAAASCPMEAIRIEE